MIWESFNFDWICITEKPSNLVPNLGALFPQTAIGLSLNVKIKFLSHFQNKLRPFYLFFVPYNCGVVCEILTTEHAYFISSCIQISSESLDLVRFTWMFFFRWSMFQITLTSAQWTKLLTANRDCSYTLKSFSIYFSRREIEFYVFSWIQ